MIRLLTTLIAIFLIASGIFTYYASQRTFEAKFKNVDGLPKGAPVTALGVKVGEVFKTKPVRDGIIVTIKITNEEVPRPPAGSQLAITSFRPGQGRILEIIPPREELTEDKAWLIQEPISTETWLFASLDLLEGIKTVSQTLIKYVTPENFQKARMAFEEASTSLSQTADRLRNYSEKVSTLQERLKIKAEEANELVSSLAKSIYSLSVVISDNNLISGIKEKTRTFSEDLNTVEKVLSNPELVTNLKSFKNEILDHLNQINTSLIDLKEDVSDPVLKQNIKNFNEHIISLNTLYEKANSKDLALKTKESVKKAREATTKASELTTQN